MDVTLFKESCVADEYRWLGIVVSALYFLIVLLARWHNIATPNRNLLLARTRDVKARASAAGLEITRLTDIETQFQGFWNVIKDFLFWSRGAENASFGTLHFFELALLDRPDLTPDRVNARLATARQQLALSEDAVGKSFATRIEDAFKCKPVSSSASLKELLIEVQYYLYNVRDTGYSTLTAWQNKSVWLTLEGLLLILVLSFIADRYVLFVAGAAGGFLSRLTKQVKRANVPNDYGASWSTLFLSPVLGALSGWFGVLLISFANEPNFGLLGGPLKQVQWEEPCAAGTLFAAFLLGFSERLFDGIIRKLEDQIDTREAAARKAPEASAALPSGVGPKLINIEPNQGPAGTEVTATLETASADQVQSVELIPTSGQSIVLDELTKSGATISFVIPADAAAQPYKIRLNVKGQPIETDMSFEVTAANGPPVTPATASGLSKLDPSTGKAGITVTGTLQNIQADQVERVDLVPASGDPLTVENLTKSESTITFMVPQTASPKSYSIRLIVESKPVDTGLKFTVT